MDLGSSIAPVRSQQQQRRIERKQLRREEERRVALKLSMPAREVPAVLRELVVGRLGALLRDPGRRDWVGLSAASYLFPTQDALQNCQQLCSRVIRRSAVPVEMQDQMVLLGGHWCRDLGVPLGTHGRYECGGWWFPHSNAYELALSVIEKGRPNDGRGAYRDTQGRYLLFAEYVPQLLRRDEMFGATLVKGLRPAWSFETRAHLEQALGHCRAVIPLSEIPRSPDLVVVATTRGGIRNGPFRDPPLICLSEEIGGLHFLNPNDLAAMWARIHATVAEGGG